MYAVALAQMVIGFAPIIDGRSGPDAQTHVEASGVRLHHAHDESDCAACLARHLLAASDLERPQPIMVTRTASTTFDDVALTLHRSRTFLTRSRAPPVVPA